MLLTLVSLRKWYVNSFDFVAAYLNADIKEDIWVRPPDGLAVPPGFGGKLRKALYGTKQAWHCWWNCVAGESFKLKWAEGCESIIGGGRRVRSEPEPPNTIHCQHNMGRYTSNEDTPSREVQPDNTRRERKSGAAERIHRGSGGTLLRGGRDSTGHCIFRQPVSPTRCSPRPYPLAMPTTLAGVLGPHDEHVPDSATAGPQALPGSVL
ncbi:hypothetical protein O181_076590 [Austropuccinia psidii MF-1]|uniref:Reverse transcriptase Ty1/copia-type domain-containing protein n=1 Tax=Austropuccinia psidii MF-1 TaxID=1389203 RepID=A0A9Q3IF60_9BASI|nr:hypothetical protein [Austropuccinia psidii MF-1]